jgi:hypothetical protein
MTVFTLSVSDTAIVDAYNTSLTTHTTAADGSVVTADGPAEMQENYANYIKVLKFHYHDLHKSVMFLNRYLLSSITNDDNLILLTQHLKVYLEGKGLADVNLVAWNAAQREIQLLMDNESIFNINVVRDGTLDKSDFTTNQNDDETKFVGINASADIDDGTKPHF